MKKKTILITGWTWYIGSHCVVAFEQAWYKTVIIDNLCNSNISTLDWIEKIIWYKPDFFKVDLRDKKAIEEVFKKYNFDGVLHFAWLKAVWESIEKPLEYFDNNVSGSICLFEIMKKYDVKNIIFSSSATVYNFDNNIPYIEGQKTWKTLNTYSNTKFLIEKILEDLSKFSEFNSINLRYFNPIWAHKSWIIGENPEWIPNNLLPFIMKVAAWEIDSLKIFGSDYDTIDWTWVRDYIDINDLIIWHILAYNKIEKHNNVWLYDCINLWVWKWTSVLEIIEVTEKVIWKKINKEIVWRRKWDLAEFYCNSEKAQKELWWKAETSLEESIENSWKFYNKK